MALLSRHEVMTSSFDPISAAMTNEGIAPSCISAFGATFAALKAGSTGLIPESTIRPAAGLTNYADIATPENPSLLDQTVVLKLNGGLGTGMGLDKAKSLLKVKGDDTFLDLACKQVVGLREKYNRKVRFLIMNSFSTSDDTMSFIKDKYPSLYPGVEMLQNKVPKLDATTYGVATCESNPSNVWCPPGHGDVYAALVGSGRLEELLGEGIRYASVSNSDNLGATMDLKLLSSFVESGAAFMMEVCERTENDKKGGHLATRVSDGQLVLRESAMCAKEDEGSFQDITKHRYFNTNNLWIDLKQLKALLDAVGGFIPLPMIINKKTVDPKDENSQKVLQLETAMGAAIECFPGSTAICVPRTRFAPVKKCDDLLLLRSDAYVITADFRPMLNPACKVAPIVSLDSKKYKLVGQLEAATRNGIPSLVKCQRLTVTGDVHMSRKCVFEGSVSFNNSSNEPKLLPGVKFSNTKVDLTAAPGLGALRVTPVKTKSIEGQKPGTSGLRKKTKVFQTPNYLENFVQSTFDAIVAAGTDITTGTLLIGGDGRFFNNEAIQIITKMAVANGVTRVWIGENGLLSTPAVSCIIRERGPAYQKAFGSFILTASHNPGGPDEDFGIKYNCENGGPAQEFLTDAIFENTRAIAEYKTCPKFPVIDLAAVGNTRVLSKDGGMEVNVEVISSTDAHVDLLRSVFDFPAIKGLLSRDDFSIVYDSMHGVNGPYARKVFCGEFGLDESIMMNSIPKDDFNGCHADPNLTYAKELVEVMGLDKTGAAVDVGGRKVPNFGAAADGDGDRNMILGDQFFVTPSDSLAVIAANADCIPFFSSQGGLKAVARSMPTSGAVDLVAKELNLNLFETPTGWKFFGNLMDSKDLFGGVDYTPFICGEESFGTGSNHIREKDGLWAVLAWLNIVASFNKPGKPLVSVADIVKAHWKKYGRNYYVRYDFEGMDGDGAKAMMAAMTAVIPANTGKKVGNYTIATTDVFEYLDPVDGSLSKNQGMRFLMADGSRVIFRLSGTAGSGATVRMYMEKYEEDRSKLELGVLDALSDLVPVALELCNIKLHCGTDVPTVIT